jgi:hypothetical protein
MSATALTPKSKFQLIKRLRSFIRAKYANKGPLLEQTRGESPRLATFPLPITRANFISESFDTNEPIGLDETSLPKPLRWH